MFFFTLFQKKKSVLGKTPLLPLGHAHGILLLLPLVGRENDTIISKAVRKYWQGNMMRIKCNAQVLMM